LLSIPILYYYYYYNNIVRNLKAALHRLGDAPTALHSIALCRIVISRFAPNDPLPPTQLNASENTAVFPFIH